MGYCRRAATPGRRLLRDGALERADKLYQQSLEIKLEIGHRRGVALVYASLGGLARKKGLPDQARSLYKDALDVALDIDSTPVALVAIFGVARILAGELDKRAIEILYFILNHPAAEQQTTQQVNALLSDLKLKLEIDWKSAEKQGRTLTLEKASDMLFGA
ncbi:MAG: tetratricopeptide repeat protein [Anaerolineales bacterium]|nr:tetratricopeptide repeat protein [Anaerolineales bacterium]